MDILASILPQFITGCLYLAVDLILSYIFLTPRRARLAQAAALLATAFLLLALHPVLRGLGVPYRVRSYMLGCLFLAPCVFIFAESLRAKLFVFFMNYSLTQLTYLLFFYLDRFISPPIPLLCVIIGLLLELAALPLVRRYMRAPVRSIIEVIDQHGAAFTLFPIVSFALLAYYDLQGSYAASTFAPLLMSTVLIFFAYYLISVSIEVTKRRQELERISNSDGLTGIYNRRHMEKRIGEELERLRRTGSTFSLAMIDIDLFKLVNDERGHDCGDFVLRELVKDIAAAVRVNDILSRWGGEEFLLLLPSTGAEQAATLAERVRGAVEEKAYEYEGARLSVTVTIGISDSRRDDTVDALVKRADLALYGGKRAGRNRVTLSP
jgi:diguanylate cyclase (GGDEF)-like protein